MDIDLAADLNSEDDDGRNWALLRDAVDPDGVAAGAVLRAGTPGFWSWVVVDAVDDHGQVHFHQISADQAHALLPSSATG